MKSTDPFSIFKNWYQEVIDAGTSDPTIMTLATVGGDGSPTARIVLLKSYDESGFVFYTNYRSMKALNLETNPRGALVFHWREPGYQIRIEGRTVKVSAKESDRYFSSRPRGSQLGAWASNQSQEIPSTAYLDESLQRWKTEFQDQSVPRPPHWGGYRVIPERIEFWSEREDRMHERILFEKSEQKWISKKLAP